jgi:hypothetical protein
LIYKLFLTGSNHNDGSCRCFNIAHITILAQIGSQDFGSLDILITKLVPCMQYEQQLVEKSVTETAIVVNQVNQVFPKGIDRGGPVWRITECSDRGGD